MKQPAKATKQDLAIIAKIEIKDNQYCPATKEELQTLIKYEDISLDTINTSAITDMSRLFIDAKATKRKDFSGINTWDTSNVTDMSYMFARCERFNEELGADIPSTSLVGKLLKSSKKSRFITSNVTTMSHMFDGCGDLNKPIKLDTHNVTDMSSMFRFCKELDSQIDLDTSNVTNMNRMFEGCSNFNQALNFNTSKVTNMAYMLFECRSFNQSLSFDTANVESFASFLSGATKFAQPFTLNTSKAKKLNYLLYATHFNHPITLDLASAENIDYMFKSCSKLTHTPKLENLNNVKSAKGVFDNCKALKDIPDMSAYNKEEPKSTSSEKKYKPTTKEELKELCDDESINLGDIDTSLITDMSELFSSSKREDFSGINTWDTSNVVNMSFMFSSCETFNEPLNFDTSNVINMNHMFYSCSSFNQPLNFDTSNVKSMVAMFEYCSSFNQALNFDMSNLESAGHMFRCCSEFNSPLNFTNVNKLKYTASMFEDCTKFNQSIEFLNGLNLEQVYSMFSGCENFNQPIGFDVSGADDLSAMFSGCKNFNQPLNFETSSAENMSYMFNECSSLEHKPDFDMSSVEEQENMFSGCSGLGIGQLLNLEDFDSDLYLQTAGETRISVIDFKVKFFTKDEVDDVIDMCKEKDLEDLYSDTCDNYDYGIKASRWFYNDNGIGAWDCGDVALKQVEFSNFTPTDIYEKCNEELQKDNIAGYYIVVGHSLAYLNIDLDDFKDKIGNTLDLNCFKYFISDNGTGLGVEWGDDYGYYTILDRLLYVDANVLEKTFKDVFKDEYESKVQEFLDKYKVDSLEELAKTSFLEEYCTEEGEDDEKQIIDKLGGYGLDRPYIIKTYEDSTDYTDVKVYLFNKNKKLLYTNGSSENELECYEAPSCGDLESARKDLKGN